jgi:arylsulfatase A-like enzyme
LDPERVIPLENYWTATTAASKEVRTAEGGSLRVGVQMRGVRKGRWKYLVRERSPLVDARLPLPEPAQVPAEEPREELYDIAADPMERLNLAATKPEQCVALRRYLPPVAATQEQ